MLSVLESPTLRARVSRLSVAEYHRLGEYNERGKRTELIRGIVTWISFSVESTVIITSFL